MAIDPISAGVDTGASVRSKLNAAIGKANLVDGLRTDLDAEVGARAAAISAEATARAAAISAEATARAGETTARIAAVTAEATARAAAVAAEATTRAAVQAQLTTEIASRDAGDAALAVSARQRPGDSPELFTAETAGGDPSLLLPLTAGGSLAFASSIRGRVARLTGAGLVLVRRLTHIESGRSYRVRWAYSRHTSPADPAGDDVRVGLLYYGQDRAFISSAVLEDYAPTSVDTLHSGQGLVARTSGSGVTVPPTNAYYVRPSIQTFGADGVTDIEILDIQDVTEASLFSPDVSAFNSRLVAIESAGLPPRMDAVEALLEAPKREIFVSHGAFAAASSPATSQVAVLLGYAEPTDLGGKTMARLSGTPSPVKAWHVHRPDGSYWVPVDRIVRPEMWGAAPGASGSTNSAAVVIAAGYCAANGIREMVVDNDLSATTAVAPSVIADVAFVGEGSFSGGGIKRKVVVPRGRSIAPLWAASDLAPAQHLPRTNGTKNPIAVLVGDSRSTYNANSLDRQNMAAELIARKFLKEFPGGTFFDRSIGGTTWASFGDNPTLSPFFGSGTANPVPWVVDGLTWVDHVSGINADLLIFSFGMNTTNDLSKIKKALDLVNAMTKVPDVLFVTPECPSFFYTDVGALSELVSQQHREWEAGLVRSVARFYGKGVIDLHRQARIARDGIDPFRSVIRQGAAVTPTGGGGSTLTFTGIRQCSDFKVKIDFDTDHFNETGNDTIWISTGPDNAVSEFLIISKSGGGFFKFDAYASLNATNTPVVVSTVTTTIPVPVYPWTFTVEKSGDQAIIYFTADSSAGAYTPEVGRLNLLVRAGDFTPYVLSPGGRLITAVTFDYGEPRTSIPTVTDSELFGAGTPGLGDYGGSVQGNHSSDFDGTEVISKVLDAQQWASAQRAWTATATLNFPSIAANGGAQDLTISVPGAAVGDDVVLGLPAAPLIGVTFNAWVSAADTVTVRATNATGSSADPASAVYRVSVLKH